MPNNDYQYSKHLDEKINKGDVNKEYVEETLKNPDKIVNIKENEIHFFKKIINFGNRCFKVVINPIKKLVVTAYFDRNMTKNGCK